MPLAHSTRSGVAWSIAARWADRLIGLVSIAILARLLAPQDFGLVAIATLTQAGVEVFFAFGFDWALVRHSNPNQQHYGTAWTLRLISGAVSATVLAAAAPIVAIAFADQRAAPIVWTLAVGVLIGCLENPYMADLRRRMDFRREMYVRVAAKLAGFIAAVSVAWLTASYWALPIGILLSKIAEVSMSYAVHPGRPTWSLVARGELVSFSVWILLSGVLGFFRTRLANLFVGRQLGSADLGVLTLGQEMANLASAEFAAPLNRAMFSRHSRVASDPDKLKQSYLAAASTIWIVTLPVTSGMALLAPEAVRLLLGSQWGEVAVILQVLCIASAVSLLAANSTSVFLAADQGSAIVRVGVWSLAGLLLALIVLTPIFGLIGAAWAQVFGAAITIPFTFRHMRRFVAIRASEIFSGLWRPTMACLCMAAVVLTMRGGMPAGGSVEEVAFRACALIGAGAVTYILVVLTLWQIVGRPHGGEAIVTQATLGLLRQRRG